MKLGLVFLAVSLALTACGGQATSTNAPDGSVSAASGAGTGSTGGSGSIGSGSVSGSSTSGAGSSGMATTGTAASGMTTSGTAASGVATTGSPSSGSGSSSGTSSGAAPDAGCLATSSYDGGPRAAPAVHRAQAPQCGFSTGCIPDGGGGQPCSTDANCASDGAYSPFSHCLRGRCEVDECLDDTDCPSTQACSCSSAYYGGNSCIHPNLCVPATCHVDADCGPGGFCSPTAGYCGLVEGFYCHKASDPCFSDTECGSYPANCFYSPAVGGFCCGIGAGCAG